MPSVSQVSNVASPVAGTLLPMIGMAGPWGAAVAGAIELIGLVDKIGQGRKAANKFTQNGGPQDIINKQLATISSSGASAEAKAEATKKAWTDFLSAANDFAAANPKQSTVVNQAIYKTPALTDTVRDLMGGADPLDKSFTDMAASGMAKGNTMPNPGPSVKGTLLRAGLAAGGSLLASHMMGGNRTIGQASQGGGFPPESLQVPEWNAMTGQWETPAAPYGPNLLSGMTRNTNAVNNAATRGGGGGILSTILGGLGGGGGNGNGGGGSNGSLLQRLLPQLISSGTSLVGGFLGSRAANNAANVQSDAALEAARMNQQAGREALGFNREVFTQQQRNLQPWLDAGTGALKSISEIAPFVPPTAEEAMKDPGIQFALQRGQKALEAYERAHGKLLSGKAVKDIDEYAQGVASTGYNDVFNRDLKTREANLNPLLSIAGLGQVSSGQLNNDLGAEGTNAANIGLSTARTVGDLNTSASAARASGYVGSANSWLNSLQNIGNNFMQQVSIGDLMKRFQPQAA